MHASGVPCAETIPIVAAATSTKAETNFMVLGRAEGAGCNGEMSRDGRERRGLASTFGFEESGPLRI